MAPLPPGEGAGSGWPGRPLQVGAGDALSCLGLVLRAVLWSYQQPLKVVQLGNSSLDSRTWALGWSASWAAHVGGLAQPASHLWCGDGVSIKPPRGVIVGTRQSAGLKAALKWPCCHHVATCVVCGAEPWAPRGHEDRGGKHVHPKPCTGVCPAGDTHSGHCGRGPPGGSTRRRTDEEAQPGQAAGHGRPRAAGLPTPAEANLGLRVLRGA